MISETGNRGTIKTRSGTWEWEVKTLRSWPRSNATGRQLRFDDPADPVNTMSLSLDPEGEELGEEAIRDLSSVPQKRRFQDEAGNLWIAHPVGQRHARNGEARLRITLHSLDHGSRVVDLPPGRTLGDLKNRELAALI